MDIGSRLKTIRKDLNLSQKDFAEKIDVHFRTITNYETGGRSISQESLIKIMQLGYSITWLLSGEGEMKMTNYRLEEAQPFKVKGDIPILGLTAAGVEGFYDENNVPNVNQAEDFVPRPKYVKDPMAYALRISSINGESMAPFFKPNDVVIASPMATVVNNDKAIVKLKDGRILFKVIKFKNDHIELISANPEYKPIIIPATDLVFAHKVVGSWGK